MRIPAGRVTAGGESELQLLLAALRASEQRFRTAINAGFDAFVIVRAVRDARGGVVDLTIVDANDHAAALVDSTVDAIVGRPLLDVFVYSRSTELWSQCLAVIETRQPFEVTQFAPLPTQQGRWVERQLLPLDDGVAISSRDVTARYLEHRALEASEARHRELFESNGAAQLVVDAASGAIVDANPAAEAFYGWPRAAMSSMLITDIDAISLAEWQAQATPMARGSGRHLRREHVVASGERRHIEAFQGLVEVEGRRLVHVIVQDATDRVRAETALRESEARFRAVLNGMRDGVVLYEGDGQVSLVNPSAARLLGLDARRSPVGINADDWRAVHEDGATWPYDASPALVALRTGASQPVELMGIVRGDGEHTWLRVCADALMRDGEARPYAAVLLFADVTDVRSAEERLRQAQKLEAVCQLAGGIAHDFNNALTVIRGSTGFLRNSVQGAAHAVEDLGAIERATERAEELTRQLLALARRQPLHLEQVDLGVLVREYGVTVRETLPSSIRVVFDLTADDAVARVDRRRTLDALRVLVDNARLSMPEGGTLTLGTRRGAKPSALRPGGRERAPTPYVELFVRDDGAGMTEETKARLFEPFFSTQPFGTGRGLGLPSVHGMMAQSGGSIECESSPGAGAEFRLRFPTAGRR